MRQFEEKSFEKEFNEFRNKQSQSLQKLTALSTRYNGFIEFKKQIQSRIQDNDSNIINCNSNIETNSKELISLRSNLDEIILKIGQNDSVVNQASDSLSNATAVCNVIS